ncbi:MAG TPA: fused MFS/spermidine synthase [Candidatus Solibacter sp.]|nr:fused MFS/spermidine synthase [Candidatus Solibacter sp.]
MLLLLAGSGCAALIYEIVWFQLLQLVIGSSAVSLGLLLAAYMGGLCVGSAVLPRLLSARRNPLRVYACLELGVGAFGIAILFGLPFVGRVYAGATSGMAALVARGAVCAVCLVPPTLLMGASFPAIARWVEGTSKPIAWMGALYSANVAGAVVGCLIAGFYLLRVYDMAIVTYVAVALNAAVALIGFLASPSGSSQRADGRRDSQQAGALGEGHKFRQILSPSPGPSGRPLPKGEGRWLIYVVIAFSGATALGAEVVWTRLLSLLLGATVYTFSIILAVFLMGLWAGSGASALLVRRIRQPRLELAGCQIALAASVTGTAYIATHVLPYWPVDPWLSLNPWFNFDLDVFRTIRTIFLPTLLWGASFPLAMASAATEGEDPARLSGEIYAANTAGSIGGALAFSLLLIPTIGTKACEQLLIGLAAGAAVVAATSYLLAMGTRRTAIALAATVAGTGMVAAGLISTVSEIPWQVIAYGRRVAPILRGLDLSSEAQPLFVGEGMNSSVVITDRGGQRFFYVSGKSEASSALLDMRLQRIMGHLPALIHRQPRSVLVVGFGAGVTAGSFVQYPDVERIIVCELEPIIPPASDEFFGTENYHVLRDHRARMIYDDARHFILTTPEKFDVITTDPIHPWVKGTSALYSKEYFELVRNHLNPGGVAAQWLPLYESDEETVKTQLATFFDVFPEGTVWSNYLNGDGYDLVLLGRLETAPIDIDEMQKRLDDASYSGVSTSLGEAEFHSAFDVMGSYAGRASDLAPMLSGAEINRDLNMRLQYAAGWGLNSVSSAQIYRRILSYRKFPDDLLTGSGERMDTLREVLGRRYRTF